MDPIHGQDKQRRSTPIRCRLASAQQAAFNSEMDVRPPRRRFDLVETMAFDPHGGIAELERHLERMRRSAEALDFAFNHHEARNELQAATFRAGPSLVRLLLSPSGAMAIELRPRAEPPAQPVPVAIVSAPVPLTDDRRRHQTSDRSAYDAARAGAGTFEVLFRDPAGYLTEGSFSNLFVERDGLLLTPPMARGLLSGVLRARLLDEGRAREVDLVESDLSGGFLIGSSALGLIRATLVSANSAGRH